jgi:hypothetical protein
VVGFRHLLSDDRTVSEPVDFVPEPRHPREDVVFPEGEWQKVAGGWRRKPPSPDERIAAALERIASALEAPTPPLTEERHAAEVVLCDSVMGQPVKRASGYSNLAGPYGPPNFGADDA